ncbi:MAG: type II toxin-antitoxin system RelE/ParE family toxin [Planctomycetes bacterium]|nr:type II toxin-antitoxin system RelE/ParE family toxin [Planctomycetota bacterium]
MIRSFADAETRRFFETGRSRRLPFEIWKRASRRLTQLKIAKTLDDLRTPSSNHLESLRGNRGGQHSVRINAQWRLYFRFAEGDAWDVEIVDYH